MKRLMLCLVGRTCAGKTTLAVELTHDCGFNMVKSYTTRKPRDGEIETVMSNFNPYVFGESKDHIFICEKLADELMHTRHIVAYTEINGNKYFVTREYLLNDTYGNLVYVVDPRGVEMLKQTCADDFDIVVLYLTASQKELQRRYKLRGVERGRIEAEDAEFTEFEQSKQYDWLLTYGGK